MTLSFEQRQVPQYLLSAVIGATVACIVMLPKIINADSVGAARRVVAESVQDRSDKPLEVLIGDFIWTPRPLVEKAKVFPSILKAAKTEDHADMLSSFAYGHAHKPDMLPYARMAHYRVHELAPNRPDLVDNFHKWFPKYCTHPAGVR